MLFEHYYFNPFENRQVTDPNGYLHAYGAGQVANVKKEERIKVAEAKTRAEIERHHANEAKEQSR